MTPAREEELDHSLDGVAPANQANANPLLAGHGMGSMEGLPVHSFVQPGVALGKKSCAR